MLLLEHPHYWRRDFKGRVFWFGWIRCGVWIFPMDLRRINILPLPRPASLAVGLGFWKVSFFLLTSWPWIFVWASAIAFWNSLSFTSPFPSLRMSALGAWRGEQRGARNAGAAGSQLEAQPDIRRACSGSRWIWESARSLPATELHLKTQCGHRWVLFSF